MKIYYGTPLKYIDITERVFSLCVQNKNLAIIKSGNNFCDVTFGDPLPGIVKHIVIEEDTGEYRFLNLQNDIHINIPEKYQNIIIENEQIKDELKLKQVHEKLKIVGGDFKLEYDEQLMSIKFIKPKARVLEIGANIGRNTLVISSLLESSENLITLETDPISADFLTKNRDINNFNFHIFNAALSKKPLYQKNWTCIPSETPITENGYSKVNIINYNDILKIFGKPDTLVADCEGALYYIFQDFPEILDHVNLVILENDFITIEQKLFANKCMTDRGFKCIYSKRIDGWHVCPCKEFFYEAWSK